jgi:glycine betaine transporter
MGMRNETNINSKKPGKEVYYISIVLSFAIVIWAIAAKNNFAAVANNLLNFLTNNFGWAYLLSMLVFVIFAVALAFSKYGRIKLGPNDSKPDYSTASWFAMLFGAGMGIGLVFWGVAEPISHFIAPPGMKPGTVEAANFAMKSSFMHWGFHPWANYSIIGLALAYFQFRKNKPGLISSIFEPLIGEKGVNGPIGKLIDIFAVFATVAGVATSLGLGTLQINSGLKYLFNIPETQLVQIIIITIITIVFIWSAVSGIEKGIKLISDVNLYLAIGLLVLSILIGPTIKIINSFTSGIGAYMGTIIQDSLHIEAFGDNSWINGWRIFYWAWWIAWAPFVGTFIARISRGRTIREFVLGVIIAPSVASFIWFATYGTMGINLGINGTMGVEALKAVAASPETGFFVVMGHYKLGVILSIIAVLLLCTFFITSANSATFVLGMLTSNGDLNPTNTKKVIWGLVQALLATALLVAGGLTSLQTASVAAAFPFIFVMLFACLALWKALKSEEI